MLTLRAGKDRGHANHGWLDTHFTFSFADYHDAEHMGFRALRVINQDTIAPGMGFGTHGHRDMEILSYVLDGELEHKDSLGSGGVLRPGEVQFMSAGSGVRHSEFNPSTTQPSHLLQIWLLPNRTNLPPEYAQKKFPIEEEPDTLHLIASRDGRKGSFLIRSDAEFYAGKLSAGTKIEPPLQFGNGWIQVARGALSVNGVALASGDGMAITNEKKLEFATDDGAEVLLFDLA